MPPARACFPSHEAVGSRAAGGGNSIPFRAPYRLRWSCSRFSRSALCTDVSFAGGEGFGFVGCGGWVGFTGFGFDMFNSPLKSGHFRLRLEFKPSLFTSDHL